MTDAKQGERAGGSDAGWRPIETAPKDGRRFIAYDPHVGMLFTMHWDDGEFLTDYERWSGRFTHWMPRPTPPNEGSEG
jgi:hypothetical protein